MRHIEGFQQLDILLAETLPVGDAPADFVCIDQACAAHPPRRMGGAG
jgi:hypothetical protein